MTRIWLVGAQVRAASNGELEGFRKDGMKVTGGPETKNMQKMFKYQVDERDNVHLHDNVI